MAWSLYCTSESKTYATCPDSMSHCCTLQTIQRGNVLEFVAYGFYCSTFEGLDLQQQAATLAFVVEAERLWNVRRARRCICSCQSC